MKFPKPSPYQLFLTTLVIVIIALLLNPGFIFPEEEADLKIGIVDSGCSLQQNNFIEEYTTFTTTEFNYSYDDDSVYDAVGHGKNVCDIIIEGTTNVAIYSAKIANGNGQVTYDGLFAAVNYLIGEKDVDIINLSLGGEPYYSEELYTAFKEYAKSKIFIAAVGNKADDFTYPSGVVDWPAALPWVIGVGSSDGPLNRSFYSSYGRDSSGLYVTEFINNGVVNDKFGTSFATPRVTVAYVNLWQDLLKQEMDVTPELLHYYVASSTSSGIFNSEIGWGVPNVANITYQEGVMIEGVNEKDQFIRFSDETWSKTWKLYANSENIELDISGNATELITKQDLVDTNWAKLLSISFQTTSAPGNYTLQIGATTGNSFTYSFEVKSQGADYRVLLDHRNTINGFAHQFGQYSRFEEYFRGLGVQVDQLQDGDTDLADYDAVLVTEFGRLLELDREFGREFNSTIFSQYLEYVEEGGILQIMGTYPSEFNSEGYANALHQLGADVGDVRIPRDANDEISFTQNVTNSDIFDGVISIGASGSEVQPVNSSQTVLGWYKFIANQIGETSEYHSIGIETTLGLGTVYVWSGSKMIQNEYFQTKLDNYDQFLMNCFQI